MLLELVVRHVEVEVIDWFNVYVPEAFKFCPQAERVMAEPVAAMMPIKKIAHMLRSNILLFILPSPFLPLSFSYQAP
jgi:hypothetical protein